MAANKRIQELTTASSLASTDLAVIGQSTNARQVSLSVLRTFLESIGDVFDVKAFDAEGDGVANDTAAFQAAYDAAETAVSSTPATGSAFVFAPPGQYMLNKIVVKDRVTLVGSGISATEFKAISGLNDNLFETKDFSTLTGTNVCTPAEGVVNNIGFRDFRIDGNKANQSAGSGLALYAKNIKISNVVIQNCKENGLYTELGDQCPLNDWDIIVEGNIDGLDLLNNDGHGWHHRGPHDQFVNFLVSYLNGGDGIFMEDDTNYNPTMDINHVHCYSNVGYGIHAKNNHFRAALCRLENNDKAGLYLENADNTEIGILHLLDNCQISGSFQGLIDADTNQCTISNLRVRRVGRTAAGGFQILGNSNYVCGSLGGDVNGGGFSTGVGMDIAAGASNNIVNVAIHDFKGSGAIGLRTGNSSGINWNNISATLSENKTQWNNVAAGVMNTYRISGNTASGNTPFAGVGPPAETNKEIWDVTLRTAAPTRVLSKYKTKFATPIDLNITTEQSFTIPHLLLATPDLDDVQVSLQYAGTNEVFVIQYMFVASVSSSSVVVTVKLSTAAGTSTNGFILMRVEL